MNSKFLYSTCRLHETAYGYLLGFVLVNLYFQSTIIPGTKSRYQKISNLPYHAISKYYADKNNKK